MQDYEGFEGTIERYQKDSTPWWPEPAHPGDGAGRAEGESVHPREARRPLTLAPR